MTGSVPVIPQPTERQRLGTQIDAAFVLCGRTLPRALNPLAGASFDIFVSNWPPALLFVIAAVWGSAQAWHV